MGKSSLVTGIVCWYRKKVTEILKCRVWIQTGDFWPFDGKCRNHPNSFLWSSPTHWPHLLSLPSLSSCPKGIRTQISSGFWRLGVTTSVLMRFILLAVVFFHFFFICCCRAPTEGVRSGTGVGCTLQKLSVGEVFVAFCVKKGAAQHKPLPVRCVPVHFYHCCQRP